MEGSWIPDWPSSPRASEASANADAKPELSISWDDQRGYSFCSARAVLHNLAGLYYQQRDFRGAAATYGKSLELNGNDYKVFGSRGQSLLYSGAPRAEAENSLRRAITLGEAQLQMHPDDAETVGLLAVYRALLGDKAAAQVRVNQAINQSGVTGRVAEYCAIAYELGGDRANALRWAQKALDTGYAWKELEGDVEMDQLSRSSNLRHSP